MAVADNKRARRGNIANRPVVDEPAACLEATAEKRVRGATNRQAALLGESKDSFAVPIGRSQRLLGVDVLSRFERHRGQLSMDRRQRQIEDDVDVGVRDQFSGRRVGLRQSMRLSLAPRLFEIASRASDDAHDVIGFETTDVDVADIADAQDANIERFHGTVLAY